MNSFSSENDGTSKIQVLLDQAIKEFSERDFLSAKETFEIICTNYPENWNARYFFAMTLCSIGDFTEAHEQLAYIANNAKESIWLQVAKNGTLLVEQKEYKIRKSIAAMI